MKLALYSDLHREQMRTDAWEPPQLDVDVVVLAGDIGSHTHGLAWAADTFRRGPGCPDVVYVIGNHEYYDAHLGLLDEMRKPKWKSTGVHLLERDVLELSGVRILGCTLWSGFDLYGADQIDVAMAHAKNGINDYWMIHARRGHRLAPRDTWRLHHQSVQWLDVELDKPFNGKTIVVTHFAPHRRCVPSQYEGSDLSPYFVTDLSGLMEKHRIDVWCFGHTHTNCDFIAENGCRVVSNQRGYVSEARRGLGFRPELVIEV
ncbi:MAG: metallophosphoesterase [Rhodocyclaceae bacterium]|nr:metallophosphoesterase [Rhodocyclaceae bacterium]